jgi:hypothetical protein
MRSYRPSLPAKFLGLDLVRHPAFDAAVNFARFGEGGVVQGASEGADILGPAPRDRHVLAILPVPNADGCQMLVFAARLYGGRTELVRLAEFAGAVPGLVEPVYIHVDYVNHRIERLDSEAHLRRAATEHDTRTGDAPCDPASQEQAPE